MPISGVKEFGGEKEMIYSQSVAGKSSFICLLKYYLILSPLSVHSNMGILG